MARLYTRTGDQGTTGVIGGPRVPKDELRIHALGDVDEANAAIRRTPRSDWRSRSRRSRK